LEVDGIVLVILIFVLRILNNGIGTIRLISLTYGRRSLAFVLAFIESSIFAFTASQVLTDFDNLPVLVAYSLGFAVGGYVGMTIEERFVTGYMVVNVIAQKGGHEIAVALRDEGFGVTESLGEGAGGEVSMLRSVVHRRRVGEILRLVNEINADAFVTVEEARAVHRGWVQNRRERLRNTLAW
jgi:uncharacterized protein YebE (UPF0316 family)